jgi:O-antigen ligase
MDKTRTKVFYLSIITASLLFVVLIVLIKPFDYNGNYIISATKWSHVIYAHFTLITYLILLITLLYNKARNIIYLSTGLLASLIGIYISGLRAGLLGAILFTIAILIIFIFDKTSIKKNLLYVVGVIFLAVIICFIYSKTEEVIINRIENLAGYEDMKFKSDETLLTRIDDFRIAWEMFREHPLAGAGFGSFKNYKGNAFSNSQKYPHNIFLELLGETGIIGLLYFLFFLFYIIKTLKKISPYLIIIFLTGFWFALFSKDIPSQSLLFIFISFSSTSIITETTKDKLISF